MADLRGGGGVGGGSGGGGGGQDKIDRILQNRGANYKIVEKIVKIVEKIVKSWRKL